MSTEISVLINILISAMAVERITEIWIDGKIFDDVKPYINNYLTSGESFIKLKILSMISCSWCFSVWVSLFISLLLPGGYFHFNPFNNIIVKWFALCGVANFWHNCFQLIYRGRLNSHDISLVMKDSKE